MVIRTEAMTEDEKKLAAEGRCIMQTWYGTMHKPRGKEVASHGGYSGYCGKNATHGNHCKGHDADLRSGNV